MRVHRMLIMLATLATIGQFILELRTAFHTGDGSNQGPRAAQPETAPPEIHRTPPRETPLQDLSGCDWSLLAAAAEVLRKRKARSEIAATERFLRLAENATHVYIVDQVTGAFYCVRRLAPVKRAVLGRSDEEQERIRREVVFWAAVVIVLAAIGLLIVRRLREERMNR